MIALDRTIANAGSTTLEAVKNSQTLFIDALSTVTNLTPAQAPSFSNVVPAPFAELVPSEYPGFDALPATEDFVEQYAAIVDSWFDFGTSLIELNREFALELTKAATALVPTTAPVTVEPATPARAAAAPKVAPASRPAAAAKVAAAPKAAASTPADAPKPAAVKRPARRKAATTAPKTTKAAKTTGKADTKTNTTPKTKATTKATAKADA